MSSPALRLLARLAPIVAVAAAACGGETAPPTGELSTDNGGAGGSSAGTGGTGGSSAGTGGTGGSSAGTGGTGGSSAGTGGTGGSSAGTGGTGAGTGGTGGSSAGTGGTGGSSAGTGGSSAGTGGSSAGTGGSSAGAAGSGGALPTCSLAGGCEPKCYDRAAGEVCLQSFEDQETIYERFGCKTMLWSSALADQETQCCYMAGQCGVGRPITVAGVALTAALLRGTSWAA